MINLPVLHMCNRIAAHYLNGRAAGDLAMTPCSRKIHSNQVQKHKAQ